MLVLLLYYKFIALISIWINNYIITKINSINGFITYFFMDNSLNIEYASSTELILLTCTMRLLSFSDKAQRL